MGIIYSITANFHIKYLRLFRGIIENNKSYIHFNYVVPHAKQNDTNGCVHFSADRLLKLLRPSISPSACMNFRPAHQIFVKYDAGSLTVICQHIPILIYAGLQKQAHHEDLYVFRNVSTV